MVLRYINELAQYFYNWIEKVYISSLFQTVRLNYLGSSAKTAREGGEGYALPRPTAPFFLFSRSFVALLHN